MDIKTIFFDLDDTLLDFDDYWKDSLIETFGKHPTTRGIEPHLLFQRLWDKNQIYEKLYHAQEITLRDFRNFRLIQAMREFDREIDEETADEFNALHKSVSKQFMKASPGLLAFLIELKKSYQLGIVTNGTGSWQHDKIEALGIKSLFSDEAIIISEDVGYEKPAPEIYGKALACTHTAPEEALFVGDSWKNDVQGPIHIGMKAIWLNKKGEAVPEGLKPYGIITNLFDLKKFLL
ncbi:HAD family hydrolase [Paenibacillus hemerocallicola]|uniref:HAD family hydrolase n=1 Tax=Paenibacillus hemerocallicola TaxID=1172614 RepID=A0A5C4TG51_9BACL|nr:HAD family hydrolase [Paenibacillus hemerocallicola]TNJ68114.1 HAD family hydrolase [Paenibacillus hemerocallicola]